MVRPRRVGACHTDFERDAHLGAPDQQQVAALEHDARADRDTVDQGRALGIERPQHEAAVVDEELPVLGCDVGIVDERQRATGAGADGDR